MVRHRIRRLILGLALSIALIAAMLGYTLWRLSWQQPAWYAPPSASDERILILADDAEYAVIQQAQQVRSEQERWTMQLSGDQINAWLATRLSMWIEHDARFTWPEQIGVPQVLLEHDAIRVALPIRGRESHRTIVAVLQPSYSGSVDNGRMSLRLISIALGRVTVPGEPLARLTDAVRDVAPEFLDDDRARYVLDVLGGRATLPTDIDLADGRRMRIVEIRLTPGQMGITAITQSVREQDR